MLVAACEVAEPFRSLEQELPCYTDYWRSLGDREDYHERWQPPNSSAGTALQDPSLGAHALNAWKYQSAEVTESVTLIGAPGPGLPQEETGTSLHRLQRRAEMKAREVEPDFISTSLGDSVRDGR